jgi:hypothetical protein
MEALNALETAPLKKTLITRMRFPIGQRALARMARVKRPAIKVVFTAAAESVEYTEGIALIDMSELVATVARLASD